MEKIMEITQEQLKKLEKSKNPIKVMKKILNLPNDVKIGLGDTTVKIEIENAKKLDVFKNTFNGKDIYYIILEVMSNDLVFAISIYPLD